MVNQPFMSNKENSSNVNNKNQIVKPFDYYTNQDEFDED